MAILTPSSSPTSSSPTTMVPSTEQATAIISKPKIGFSIDSIVGTAARTSSSPAPSPSCSSRSVSPADAAQHSSELGAGSPRPISSSPPVMAGASSSSPVGPSPLQGPPGGPWPAPHPAYFEALANMRALYGQPGPHPFAGAQPPHQMMMAGPPPPPGSHPWWLLAQARQQQQRLLAAAAVQRFPAGKSIEISSFDHQR